MVILKDLRERKGEEKYERDLEYDEKTATPDDVVEYLCGRKKYGIGYYAEPGVNTSFVPGGGYTKEEVLQIITIRYALSLNSYQKYIATTVASDISEETLAVVIENSDLKATVKKISTGY